MSETEPPLSAKDQASGPPDYGISDLPVLLRPLRIRWGKLAGIVSASVFTCGFLYLWGYWQHFDVAFLDYMSFDEIVSRSLFGVVPSIVLVVEFMLMAFAIMGLGPVARWLERTEAEAKVKRDARSQQRSAYLFMPLLFLGFGVGAGLFGIWQDQPVHGGMMTLPFIGGMIGWVEGLRRDFRLKQLGFCIGLVVGLFPMIAFFSGATSAERLRTSPDLVREFATTLEGTDAAVLTDRIYVGRMGGYVFFSSKTHKSTVALPEAQLKYLHTWRPKAPAKK